jgi:adenine-specific DNA-methyltransferase
MSEDVCKRSKSDDVAPPRGASSSMSDDAGSLILVQIAIELLKSAERRRVATLAGIAEARQVEYGQYFTPDRAARLVASLPSIPSSGSLRILDPGAGSGSLTAALVARIIEEAPGLSLHVTAVEIDDTVLPALRQTLDDCALAAAGAGIAFTSEVVGLDFLTQSAGIDGLFDLVVMNPPYSKLAAHSAARVHVADNFVETPNLYAAFMAVGTSLLEPQGQLVAIVPRSFTNGAYFEPFRNFLLDRLAINRIHIFGSRSSVFADTGVLQENIVLSATREGEEGTVRISTSVSHTDELIRRDVPYFEIVHPSDKNRYIRIPSTGDDSAIVEQMGHLPVTLADIGITVSTGRVVDFRSRDQLVDPPLAEHYPMIYPSNVRYGRVVHPLVGGKIQEFSIVSEKDPRMLVPQGTYVLIKRFSAKEERRRLVAGLWLEGENQAGPVAFDNKLNYLHVKGEGLDKALAAGLSLWLNSTTVDAYFRTFSGHTQVNATDLRGMRFPSAEDLRELGSHLGSELPEQDTIDQLCSVIFTPIGVAA